MQPAKRRRSDAAPTPQSIAASNATSRLMLGCHGAQRSWMNHISSPDAHVANTAPTRPQPSPRRAEPQVLRPILSSTSYTTTTPASAQTHTSPPAHSPLPTHGAQSPTYGSSHVEPICTVNALREKVPGRTLIRTVNGLRDESHTLKRPHQQAEQPDSEREPPLTANTIPTPSTTYSRSHSHSHSYTTMPANEAARPSPRLAIMDSQSLPSPAPSDEYDPKSPRPSAPDVNGAPGRAETPLHMFREGRLRPSNPSQTNIRNTVQTNVPSPSTTALPSPSPITSISPHSNVRPSSAATANARSNADTMLSHIQTAPSPRNGAPQYSPDIGSSLQNLNAAPLHTHVQSDTPRLQNTWGVFAPAFCLPRIDNFRAHYHTQLGRSDGYRVTLLRQAVEAQDYFYLLLVSSHMPCRSLRQLIFVQERSV